MRAVNTILDVAVSRIHISSSHVFLQKLARFSASSLARPFCHTRPLRFTTSKITPFLSSISPSSPSLEMGSRPQVRKWGVLWSVLFPHHSPLPLLQSKPSVNQHIQSPSQLLYWILPTQHLPQALLYKAARGTLQKLEIQSSQTLPCFKPFQCTYLTANLPWCLFPTSPCGHLLTVRPQLPWVPSNMPSSSPLGGRLTQSNGDPPQMVLLLILHYGPGHFSSKRSFLQCPSCTVLYLQYVLHLLTDWNLGSYVLLFLIIYW